MTDLRRHVPRIALAWDDDAPGSSWQSVDATLVFADISGFTALTERLARRGRIGAEELIETLNRVFGGMLAMAGARGGELLKFGGDALLFTFRGDDHAVRACAAAVDMRAALREASAIPTSVGRLKLRMSVGIHSGPVDFFLVGAPTRELLILGPAATATADAEKLANAGEIVVTTDTAARLPRGSARPREDGALLLRWRSVAPPLTEPAPMPEVEERRLRALFPHALGDYLADRVPDPEHKIATIGFARFSGTDALLSGPGPEAVGEALDATVSVFMRAMNDEGVTLLATDLDSDGGKLFMGSGVPYSSEDDEGRMLRAMRRVLDVGTPLPLQIGVNRGHVFAAEVGAVDRAAYSAMGDTTNTAARIMGKAPHGVLFAHPTVLERSRTLFSTTPAGPFPMKGKTVPVPVHSVGEETGTRGTGAGTALPLLGRDVELDAIRSNVGRMLMGDGGVVIVSGGTGTGKSRVVAEALAGFDVRTITVRAEPYGATAPYRVLRDPVRALLGVERGSHDEMADAVRSGVRRLAPELLAFAPLLGDVVTVSMPETPEVRAIEPRFRPDRIADLILRLVETTFPGPLLLRVEEGHWADAASAHVLARFAAEAVRRPWAMLVTRRDEGGFDPDGERVELAPLDDDVIRRLVIAATAATPMRPHEIDEVVRRAGGNPLFVEEITRVFQEVGSLDSVPENLHAALDAQIDALDPHSRRILRYASVLGRSFRTEVLNETIRNDELVVDAATLSRLESFLEPDGSGRLRFRNGMIRDAAYEGLAYRLRATLHAAAGRAVEKLSEDLEADSDTLSLHFWRGGDDAATWRYSRLAGDRAARAYANADAAVLYERALEAGRKVAEVPDVDKRDLYRRLGEVRDLAGMYEQSLDAFRLALRLSQEDPLMSAALLRQRAQVRQRSGAFGPALAELSKAERMLDGETSVEARRTRVRLRSVRAGIRLEQERLQDALDIASTLLDEARETGEFEALEQALLTMDVAGFQLGDTSVGERTREALAVMNARGNSLRAFAAHGNLGGFAYYAGRAAAQEVGDVVGSAIVALSLGEVLASQRRFDEADAVLADAVRVLRVSGVPAFAAYGEVHRARVLLGRGDVEAAERHAQDAELELVALGQKVSALEAALVRVEALTRQGRTEDALTLLESNAGSATGEGVALQPRINLERARAASAEGRYDEALAETASGVALADQYSLPFERAQLLRLQAEVRTRAGDREGARADADEAAEVLRGLGVLDS
ncbi:MAG: adenylate/guanylate cyclase domain-containing protein [Candidatus Nanopelagicales bacterium]